MKTTFTKLIVIFTTFASQLILAQTYNYTWMKGAPSTKYAVYGVQGVANINNTPGSGGGVTWTDAAGNLWLYGGQGWTDNAHGARSDMWKYSPTNNCWTWVKGSGLVGQALVYGTLGVSAASNNPGCREFSASWADAAGNLWLFGGFGNAGVYNDLWRYNIASNQWAWMGGANTPSQTAVYGTMSVPSTANIPGASHMFVSWKDPSGNFWLYDGIDGTEVWKYNPSSGQWAWMSGTNAGTVTVAYGTMGVPSPTVHPGERWTKGVGDASGNLYIFGGRDLTGPSFTTRENDLWKYDISTNQWTWIDDSPSSNGSGTYGVQGVFSATAIPPGRYGHTLWADNNNKLWLFGGEIPGLAFFSQVNDTWCFDIATGQWAWMKGSNIPFQSFPSPVSPSGAIYGTQGVTAASNTPGWCASTTYWPGDPGTLWMFPGILEDSNTTELWKFSSCVSNSTINISSSNATLCAGSTATLTANGAAGTYSWSTGAQTQTIIVSPSITTTYYAAESGTSNCSTPGQFTLSVQSQTVSISSSSNTICGGQSASLTASGSSLFTWNAGQTGSVIVVTPLSTTVYTVTGTANGCSSAASFTQQVTSPTLHVNGPANAICPGEPVLLMALGANNYTWSLQGLNSPVIQVYPFVTTSYSVTGIDNSGCKGEAAFILNVSACVDLKEYTDYTNVFDVYPNPASTQVTIKATAGKTLKIINSLGELVLEKKLDSETLVIHGDLSPGIYYCTLGEAGKAFKLVIQ